MVVISYRVTVGGAVPAVIQGTSSGSVSGLTDPSSFQYSKMIEVTSSSSIAPVITSAGMLAPELVNICDESAQAAPPGASGSDGLGGGFTSDRSGSNVPVP